MPIQRMATDVFKDGGLGPTGQAVYDHIKNISGKDSNIIHLDFSREFSHLFFVQSVAT